MGVFATTNIRMLLQLFSANIVSFVADSLSFNAGRKVTATKQGQTWDLIQTGAKAPLSTADL